MPTVKTRAKRGAAKITAAIASIPVPKLAKGERWAGLAFVDGKPSHNLIILPADEKMAWTECAAWANKQGGEMPTRAEQALMYANAKDAFKRDTYWSGEQTAGDPDWAWYQWFDNGYQRYTSKDGKLRVRAVRREPI